MTTSIDLTFLRTRRVQGRIAAVAFACAILGGLYAFLSPRWYRSVLTVVPAKSQRGSGGIASLLGGDAAGLAAGFVEGAGGGADVARISAVLQSVAVTDAVIEHFDLRTRYEAKSPERAREAIWGLCQVTPLPKPQLVQLSCEDQDPRFVQQLLEYFADYGNQVFRRISVSSASEEVRYLDRRVAELREQADSAANRLREFQEQYRIIDLETQAKAVVSELANLNASKINKQLELEYGRKYSAPGEPSLRQLESQLSVMHEKQRDLEDAPATTPAPAPAGGRRGARGTIFPPALEVPKLRAEYEKLLRDRKVAEAALIFSLERLESARASEARDVSTFLVLDPPPLPTRPVRPKRLTMIGLFAILGAALATTWEAWRANAIPLARRGPAAGGEDRSPIRAQRDSAA